jgi:UDP-galactopyranose mutase
LDQLSLDGGMKNSNSHQHCIVCFSHLRWKFVFQRPQHLMTRFARKDRVIYWEEPIIDSEFGSPNLKIEQCPESGVIVVTPQLPPLGVDRENIALRRLLDGFLAGEGENIDCWYYTPMMLPFSRHLRPSCIVYDCMDELSNFRNAPPELAALERELLDTADVVFTGGYSLYEAKRDRHPNIHPFPSSVDRAHFARARGSAPPGRKSAPRLGFYGVVDERMDLSLLEALAEARPTWSIEIIGPVVKIDPATLPRRPNLHYLGGKSYEELPDHLASWDVALMPFAINDATRFISPTKTPEYLAGGKPVVSTPIKDVVRHYGDLAAVRIAGDATAFIAECDRALELAATPGSWLPEVDRMLAELSWDRTFDRMSALMRLVRNGSRQIRTTSPAIVVPARKAKQYDYLVVGAGFAGSVMAERLAAGAGKKVLLIDRRPHIGGNAYDHHDAAGILIHQYGPHIFHTNSAEIFDYLSRFTEWRPYEHHVLADIGGLRVPMPINRTTLNKLYGLSLATEEQAEAFLASRAEPIDDIRTSEDVVISKVGRELYETFFRGYTRKQWGMDPSELDKAVTARVPTRTNTDDRYFTDSYQAMPAKGFTRMFENMLDHPNIDLLLGVDFAEVRDEIDYESLVFTGPIDEYFDYRYGTLPYRSLHFRHETLDQEWLQQVAVVNYPDEAVPYTRVTEYKHLTGQRAPRTSITYEYPSAEGDPYYPIPREENQALFKRYEALALATSNVHFVGRLATYRYYNMDQVVGQALATFRRIAAESSADKLKPARRELTSTSKRTVSA